MENKFDIYHNPQKEIPVFLESIGIYEEEINTFDKLLKSNIYDLTISETESDAYVLHRL